MSRYDRGQEPPGTDRLRTRIGAAREVVPWVPHAASGSGR